MMEELNDNSPMPFGKHAGTPMANVPARYLIWLHDENKCTPQVRAYIVENMEDLKQEAG